MEVTINHTYTLDQELDFRSKEFKQDLHKDINIFLKYINIITFCLSILYIPLIAYPFIMVRIFYNYVIRRFFLAFRYASLFNRKESLDNYFIEEEFEFLDASRIESKLPHLLPFLDFEKKKVLFFIIAYNIIADAVN